jgi:light-regulated signal transduction histidine kinase (bacteriophytochrome)
LRQAGKELPSSYEADIIRKDGEIRNVEVFHRNIIWNGEKQFQTIWHDVTEQKKAEAEREALLEDLQKLNAKLEESNKELQDFVYVASHDLREPLRKIASFGSLLQDSLKGKLDEDQQENFQFMIDGSNRMQAMVDDLLTYSRVTTKARPFEAVDLNEAIEDIKNIELAEFLKETEGTINIPEKLKMVKGDSPQLHQLLQNLIGNGLKFRRNGVLPEVTIRTRNGKGNMVHVEIQDNGIGIDEKYFDQIFTMFKRLHSRTRYEGTGIGLAVCKKIVRRHGGEIGVESQPGEGSKFWFTLPGV